jgi:Recombinase
MSVQHSPDEKSPVWSRLDQGRQAKAANGGYAGYGSPAFGQQTIGGELQPHPEECEIIELIRRHHKSGKSLQKIADWLNDRGYTTKRQQPWQRVSVKRVLDRLYGKTDRLSGLTPLIAQPDDGAIAAVDAPRPSPKISESNS